MHMPLLTVAATSPTPLTHAFLVLAILLALSFEFVNGFHDTANAVATVIYTNTLRATPAVIWSGLCNLLGVLTSSGLVAFGIVALLPVELVLNIGSAAGFAMVFSLLLSAILWNLGTWYLGLPASSSHTLIGSILGVGLANALLGPSHAVTEGVNWVKTEEVGVALLISPLIGFAASALLLWLTKRLLRTPALFRAPEGKTPPPLWIRVLLIVTCSGVSFAHGSNDGQKGMGLIVLILVGLLPGSYALRMTADQHVLGEVRSSAQQLGVVFQQQAAGASVSSLPGQDSTTVVTSFIKPAGQVAPLLFAALSDKCTDLEQRLQHNVPVSNLPAEERAIVRTDLYLLAKSIRKLQRLGYLRDPGSRQLSATLRQHSEQLTNFIPDWVKAAVALALGLGTMIGYRRIVITVGERIGKEHLSYAQGGAAELVTMSTILLADHFGAPVSTTHVLSSGIAGTMAANNSGLQVQTLRNILMAWVLTLPACIFLGALTFAFSINVIALLGIT